MVLSIVILLAMVSGSLIALRRQQIPVFDQMAPGMAQTLKSPTAIWVQKLTTEDKANVFGDWKPSGPKRTVTRRWGSQLASILETQGDPSSVEGTCAPVWDVRAVFESSGENLCVFYDRDCGAVSLGSGLNCHRSRVTHVSRAKPQFDRAFAQAFDSE